MAISTALCRIAGEVWWASRICWKQ